MDSKQSKDLVLKISKNQDKQAFRHIFEYFAPRIMGYLIKSGSKKEIAEEITQETLTTIWQKSYQFDYEKGNVNTWVFTIARNKRIDKYRKNENPTYNSDDLVEALYSNINNQEKDLRLRMIEIHEKSNENEKKLIKMNFFEGKTHKKISSDLEIPLGTVKSRIRNILLKMKKL